MDWWSFFFSFRGRMNRAKYWLALLIFFIVDTMLGLLGSVLGNTVAFQIFSFFGQRGGVRRHHRRQHQTAA